MSPYSSIQRRVIVTFFGLVQSSLLSSVSLVVGFFVYFVLFLFCFFQFNFVLQLPFQEIRGISIMKLSSTGDPLSACLFLLQSIS